MLGRNCLKLYSSVVDKSIRSVKKHTLSNLLDVERGAYSSLTENDLKVFESILGKNRVVTDAQALQFHNQDWLGKYKGSSKLLLLPKATIEASEILKYCNQRRLAVCPQGGNTGLVGGSIPIFDEIILSSKLLNKVIEVDVDSSILKCQSGCILQSLDSHLEKYNLMMPLDLGAKGSCHIGGNVSTNAGGLRLLRYGSLKGRVLGLEVVLADGTIINTMANSLRKDNTGYDLKQLFIGSEGTLGFITGVSIWCVNKPKAVNVAVISCNKNTFQNVVDVFNASKQELNEILSAFEFIDRECMVLLKQNMGIDNPFAKEISENCQFYCLVETHGSSDEHDREKLTKFMSGLFDKKLCSDAVISESLDQVKKLWSLRESVTTSLSKDGYTYKYDISLPLSNMYDIVDHLRKCFRDEKIENFIRCVAYGHIGDGNLHLNITSKVGDDRIYKILEPFVFEWTMKYNGSISAEHGIGSFKSKYLHYSKSQESIGLMRQFKRLMDPKCILNPYKVLS
jgi:FAD/FMN-containing dehydrogenase